MISDTAHSLTYAAASTIARPRALALSPCSRSAVPVAQPAHSVPMVFVLSTTISPARKIAAHSSVDRQRRVRALHPVAVHSCRRRKTRSTSPRFIRRCSNIILVNPTIGVCVRFASRPDTRVCVRHRQRFPPSQRPPICAPSPTPPPYRTCLFVGHPSSPWSCISIARYG